MIKVYKLRASKEINNKRLKVLQPYRLTPGKEYICRSLESDTMIICDDIGNNIEFEAPEKSRFKNGEIILDMFTVVDSWKGYLKKQNKI